MSGPPEPPASDVAGATAAHRRLRATLSGIDDATAHRPSLLPDWTVGHVVTHLARNADSMVRVLTGAMAGEHLEQYEGGAPARAAAIEAGAGRPAADLVADALESASRLEEVWAAMPPSAWDGYGMAGGRAWPCRQLPFFRWREVEVHHVDLGLGYTPADWPDAYVDADLPRAVAAIPDRLADPGQRRALLAWLMGRGQAGGPAGLGAGLDLAPWQSRREHDHRAPPSV